MLSAAPSAPSKGPWRVVIPRETVVLPVPLDDGKTLALIVSRKGLTAPQLSDWKRLAQGPKDEFNALLGNYGKHFTEFETDFYDPSFFVKMSSRMLPDNTPISIPASWTIFQVPGFHFTKLR